MPVSGLSTRGCTVRSVFSERTHGVWKRQQLTADSHGTRFCKQRAILTCDEVERPGRAVYPEQSEDIQQDSFRASLLCSRTEKHNFQS